MYGEIRPAHVASGVRWCTLCGQQLALAFCVLKQ